MKLETVKNDIHDFLSLNKDGVVVIWGATATGKTGLSVQLCDFFDIEVISCDSRQIFKYMDIGTDKISHEIRQKLIHHQIDILEPDQTYTAGQRKIDSVKIISDIQSRNMTPFIVGGTGLYIDTIYKNFDIPQVEPDFEYREELYKLHETNPSKLREMLNEVDPKEAGNIHPNSSRYLVRALEIYHKTGKPKSEIAKPNPVKNPLMMIGLRRQTGDTNKKIDTRINEMIDIGLIEEVKSLLDRGYTRDMQALQSIGYKEIIGYILGEYSLDEAVEKLKINTHRYAKRQRTWFRRYINDATQNPRDNVVYKLYNL